jgi:transcriptional regulator with XRE-family HTH domain
MENEDFNYTKKIGKKIKLARTKAGYTQEELAEKLSLSTRYISQLERGISFGTASTIISICKALNITADFLFADIINPTDSSNIFDLNFSKNYIRLNDENKELLHLIAADLLKYQSRTNFKQL